MNAEGLLAHYVRIADAPDAIARLRRFVLDLAIRGKLVAQDKHDEPATALLKKIDAEKARLAKEGQIQQSKVPSSRAFAAPLYSVPRGWEWATISAIVNSHVGGGTPSKNNPSYWDGGIYWASVKDVGKSKYLDQTIDTISEAGLTNSSSNLISPGHVIVVTRMGLGKVSINRVPTAINQDLRALSLSSLVSIDYCYLFFLTHGFEGSGLTVKGIKVEQLLSTPFPLPPLPEQHRIVAKVDELMALCDQLETARARREATRDRLAAASLARLNTPDPDTFRADARFALDALPALTTRPDQIKQLRQTILNLAVRGKLVPQDQTDEPAAKLLAGVTEERNELVELGLLRRESDVLPICHDEPPFSVPTNWQWAKVGETVLFTQYGTSQKAHQAEQGVPVLAMGNIQDGAVVIYGHEKRVRSNSDELPALFLKKMDLLYNRTNSAELVGKTGLYLGESDTLTFASYLIRLRPSLRWTSPTFLNLWMNTSEFRETQIVPHIKKQTGQANVNGTILKNMLVPLPPLAEQHRIVAKVGELMALCNQLEANLVSGEATRSRLLDALLHEALAPTEQQAA